MSKPELLRVVHEHDVHLNKSAEMLFADPRFTTLSREHVIDVTALSVAALGFGEGATYGQITSRALECGLTECPLELGPHLRLQFLDQPDGIDGMPVTHGRAPIGSITVASRPLDDTDEAPKGFYLRRVGGVLWLRGYRAQAGHVWSPGDVFVFSRATRPNKPLQPTSGGRAEGARRADAVAWGAPLAVERQDVGRTGETRGHDEVACCLTRS